MYFFNRIARLGRALGRRRGGPGPGGAPRVVYGCVTQDKAPTQHSHPKGRAWPHITALGRASQDMSISSARPPRSSAQGSSIVPNVGIQASNGAFGTPSYELPTKHAADRAPRMASRAQLLTSIVAGIATTHPAHTSPRAHTCRSREESRAPTQKRVMDVVEHRPGAHSGHACASHSAPRRRERGLDGCLFRPSGPRTVPTRARRRGAPYPALLVEGDHAGGACGGPCPIQPRGAEPRESTPPAVHCPPSNAPRSSAMPVRFSTESMQTKQYQKRTNRTRDRPLRGRPRSKRP